MCFLPYGLDNAKAEILLGRVGGVRKRIRGVVPGP